MYICYFACLKMKMWRRREESDFLPSIGLNCIHERGRSQQLRGERGDEIHWMERCFAKQIKRREGMVKSSPPSF